MSNIIELKQIKRLFRTPEVETIALENVNLEVANEEFVAVMGPSGCGKSTLLNILGLLDNPTAGSYQLLGKEVAQLTEKERTAIRKGTIGFVFQYLYVTFLFSLIIVLTYKVEPVKNKMEAIKISTAEEVISPDGK